MAEQVKWYVPSITQSNLRNLPDGLMLTIFDPAHYTDKSLTTEKIQKDFALNAKATGEYINNFSPERLAVHETIVGIATQLKLDNEEHFVKAFQDIYQNQVLPVIQQREPEFTQEAERIRSAVKEAADLYLADNEASQANPYTARVAEVAKKFATNLANYEKDAAELAAKAKVGRPTRADRERLVDLNATLSLMRENKEAIIVELVSDSEILKANKKIIQEIVSGTPEKPESGILAQEPVASTYEKLTLHNQQDRKGYLVVGGAASGKLNI